MGEILRGLKNLKFQDFRCQKRLFMKFEILKFEIFYAFNALTTDNFAIRQAG
jgi:hypothetical protein